MKSIVIVGENSTAAEKRYLEFLKSRFECGQTGRITVLQSAVFLDESAEKEGEEIVLCGCREIEKIKSRNCILLLEESFCARNRIGELQGCTAIVSSENECGVKLLAERGIQTVTCGLSRKDTVTISSITGERVMVSVQRELQTCSGKTVQPVEIPVVLHEIKDRYIIMSCTAAMLLAK